ncbi:MAG TPA: phage major capsid protein [Acidimicrobiia bacterium]
MESYIKRQQELRMAAWEQAKALLDTAASEGRDLTAEEQQTYDRINVELDERSATIERFKKDQEREARAAETFVPDMAADIRSENMPSDRDMLRKLVTGEIRSHRFEARDLVTGVSGDGPELVPQGFYDVLQRKLEYAGPMMMADVVTVLNTESGNDIKVPVESSRSAATATAEAAVFGETDPQFTTLTLRAHKYGALVQVSSELLNESGIDLVGYLSDQFAVAIGTAVNYALTLGGGTTEPAGIVPGAGAGKTGGTGVSGAFTANDLIDLAHAVDSAYARRPKAGFMMSRASLGGVRKLQDGGGNYIYNPQIDGPDQLLGYPIFENPDMAATGTAEKSVLFGDFGAYHTRIVGAGVDVARSDDFAFGNDLITFRASIRLDGALGGGGSDAVKYFIGGAS